MRLEHLKVECIFHYGCAHYFHVNVLRYAVCKRVVYFYYFLLDTNCLCIFFGGSFNKFGVDIEIPGNKLD